MVVTLASIHQTNMMLGIDWPLSNEWKIYCASGPLYKGISDNTLVSIRFYWFWFNFSIKNFAGADKKYVKAKEY